MIEKKVFQYPGVLKKSDQLMTECNEKKLSLYGQLAAREKMKARVHTYFIYTPHTIRNAVFFFFGFENRYHAWIYGPGFASSWQKPHVIHFLTIGICSTATAAQLLWMDQIASTPDHFSGNALRIHTAFSM